MVRVVILLALPMLEGDESVLIILSINFGPKQALSLGPLLLCDFLHLGLFHGEPSLTGAVVVPPRAIIPLLTAMYAQQVVALILRIHLPHLQ